MNLQHSYYSCQKCSEVELESSIKWTKYFKIDLKYILD